MLVAVLGATAEKKACASHVGGGRLSAYPAALNAVALLFLKLLELSFAHLIQAAASFLRLERPLIRRDLMRRRVTDSANQCGCLRAALRARVGKVCDPPCEAAVAEEVVAAVEAGEALGGVVQSRAQRLSRTDGAVCCADGGDGSGQRRNRLVVSRGAP